MEIKKYKINFENWECITKKKFIQKKIDNYKFTGYIGLLLIEDVKRRQEWDFFDNKIIVCDKNYIWLTIIPDNKNCIITAMMTPEKKVLLWYVDIMENLRMGNDGILEYDDLFLDYIIMPNGMVYEEDRDELIEAYNAKIISHRQFSLTEYVTNNLIEEGYLNNETLSQLTAYLYGELLD